MIIIHVCFFAYLGVYHVYDGFIFPTQNWHEKIISYLTKLKIDTMQSHRYALFMYLQNKKLVDRTEMMMTISNISKLLEKACEIYFQLNGKNYMRSDESKGCICLKCTEQLHKGLEEVSICIMFI